MTTTEITNLALTHLGEPPLTALDSDTTVAAITARAHYALTLNSILEEHAWSFARKRAVLVPSEIDITYDMVSSADFTVPLTLTLSDGVATVYTGTRSGILYTLYRYTDDIGYEFTPLINEVSLIVTNEGDPVTSRDAYHVDYPATDLVHKATLVPFNDESVTSVTITLKDNSPWLVSYALPDDCLRYLRIAFDKDTSLDRFEILDRRILTDTEDFLNLFYITSAPPATSYPAAFTRALALLLASNIAPQITRDESLSATLLQKYQLTLAEAIRKDTRETQSGENTTPAKLARNSGLWNARFRSHGAPGLP